MTFTRADSDPIADRKGPGRPPTAPRCPKCGAADYACKCPKEEKIELALNDDTCAAMIRFLGAAEGFAVSVATKIPYPKIEPIWSYSDEEIERLTPSLKKVGAKYSPEFLVKYQDELALLMTLFEVSRMKLMQTVLLVQMERAAAGGAKESGAPAHTAKTATESTKAKEAPKPATPKPTDEESPAQILMITDALNSELNSSQAAHA